MRVGFARVDITPPVGTELTGFIARDAPSAGVHDRLFARALAFEDGGARAAVVSVDLIGLGRNLVGRLRGRVASATGIPPEHQLYAATHTHGGPETGVISTLAAPSIPYLIDLEKSIVRSVERAVESLEPALIGYGDAESAVGQNRIFARDGAEGPYDPTLGVIRISSTSGRPLATLVNYACHATAAGPVGLINADYPGRLAAALEASGYGPVVFVNGAGADVNPRGIDGRGVELAERVGDSLAADVAPIWRRIEPSEWAGIHGRIEGVRLPLRPLPDEAEVAALQEEGRRIVESAAPGSLEARAAAITHARYAAQIAEIIFGRRDAPDAVISEVQSLGIGPVVFAALPGESFTSAGRAARRAFDRPTVIAGWANDLVGYIADESAYQRGGYEVELAHRYYGLPAPFATSALDEVVEACRRLSSWLGAVATS